MESLLRYGRKVRAPFDLAMAFLHPWRRAYYGSRFVAASEGETFERSFAAFAGSAAGTRLIALQPEAIALLSDRATLAAHPSGSLGQRYAEFANRYALDEDYYYGLALQALGERASDERRWWYRRRFAAMHDMFHVLTGYRPHTLGEGCLMSFRYGQTRHFGVLCLAVMIAALQIWRPGALRCLREAYRRGRDATRLELLPWEERLGEPLAAQRAWLGIAAPAVYRDSYAAGDYPALGAMRKRPALA